MKYSDHPPSVDAPDLFVTCSSFPPFVWELKERNYPNREIAASRDVAAIHAAARLHAFASKSPR